MCHLWWLASKEIKANKGKLEKAVAQTVNEHWNSACKHACTHRRRHCAHCFPDCFNWSFPSTLNEQSMSCVSPSAFLHETCNIRHLVSILDLRPLCMYMYVHTYIYACQNPRQQQMMQGRDNILYYTLKQSVPCTYCATFTIFAKKHTTV